MLKLKSKYSSTNKFIVLYKEKILFSECALVKNECLPLYHRIQMSYLTIVTLESIKNRGASKLPLSHPPAQFSNSDTIF